MKKIGFVYPGQGSQRVGMGKEWATLPGVSSLWKQADEILGYSLSHICFEGPEETLTQTQHAQASLFMISASLTYLLKEAGIVPSLVAGHSLGELTAYATAGVYDIPTALCVIQARGEAMAKACPRDHGGMVAILGASVADIEAALADVDMPVVIANYNCPSQYVISGEKKGVYDVMARLKEKGFKAIPLPVSGPFHSPLMQSASVTLAHFLEEYQFSDASIPILLNQHGKAETSGETLKKNLSQQVVSSVRWIDTIVSMANTVDVIVEVGHGKVLTGLIKKIVPGFSVYSVSTPQEIEACLPLLKGG